MRNIVKKIIAPALFLIQLSAVGNSDPSAYPVADIPEGLKANADAVIRLREASFVIESMDRASYSIHQVVTVLNSDAESYGQLVVGYDKLVKVAELDAIVRNERGEVIRKLKNKEIQDFSSISGYSLFEDSRQKYVDLRQKVYPYTIEYTLQLDYKYLYSVPNFVGLPNEHVAVEQSTYEVQAPGDLLPRYKQLHMTGEPERVETAGLITLKWQLDNLEAKIDEQYAPKLPDNPEVLLSPSKFRYEGYEGDMSTWDDYAKWLYALHEGRNDLSGEAKEDVRTLVKGFGTQEEKVRAIYEYMQNRTRYVNIKLGIGGLQPLPASAVEQNGYGDCKALTFYTQSLLGAVDIPSLYAVVSAGNNPRELHKDFPGHYFNHVILCVPIESDTLWLECTSQSTPMGYLGNFTGDREVLLVSEEGGAIARTPAYEGPTYRYNTSGQTTVDDEGHGTTQVVVEFVGQAVDDVWHYLFEDDDSQRKWLQRLIEIPSYELVAFSFETEKDRIPKVRAKLDLRIRKVASVTGNRLLLQPNLLHQSTYIPPAGERVSPISLRHARSVVDTISYILPLGAYIEKVPETISIDSEFGSYRAEFQRTENELIYIRSLNVHKGQWDPEEYVELIDFYKQVRRADRKKVIVSTST